MYLWFSIFEVQLVYSLVNDAFHIEILMRMYSGGFFKKERPIIEVKCVTNYSIFLYLKLNRDLVSLAGFRCSF